MAQRTSEVVPELHVALAAWALDELVDDRAAAPWSAVRERASRGNAYGVDAALRAYVSSIAAARFDAGGLVQALITQTPLSPGPNDASIVLWLLEVAIDRCARALSADEPGLRALIDRRATITERLALELDERAFTAPDIGSFDPDAAVDDGADVYLSPMEALLLDIAVAPAAPDEAWLTYPQAEQLFGQHARAAHAQTDKQRRRTAAALLVGAGFAGATLALGLALVAVDASIAISAGLGLTLAWASLAVVHGRPALADRRRADAFGVACVSGGLCAAVNLVNQLLDPPLFSDAAGLIAGALLSAVAALAWAVLHARTQGDGRT